MENVTLTPKEQSRLQVLNSLAAEHMTLDQAAELMGVTSRHTRRILAAYRERGAAALAHGHRGRRPVNATPEALVVDLAHLARTRYAGVNHTHLAELLAEREGIPEYWRFDETGRHHGSRLAGDRLVDGQYEPIHIEELAEDTLQGYSGVLNLNIRWEGVQLRWYDPTTDQHIVTFDDERARADRAEAQVQELEAELQRLREA